MSAHLERARRLLETHRPADAEREARSGLAESPRDPLLLHALCSALLGQKKLAAAAEVAQSLQTAAPNWTDAHLILCCVELERGQVNLAERAALEARRLAPTSPTPRQNLAACYLRRECWDGALVEAEAGLALDPTHVGCAQTRTLALMHMGRKQESVVTANIALAQDASNSASHNLAGWAKLNSGDYRAAKEHFSEALRLNPTADNSRAGLLESMKAHNPLYRAMFALLKFMASSKLSEGASYALRVLFLVGFCFVPDRASAVALPLVVVAIGFLLVVSCSLPFFNVLIMFDPIGRHALQPYDRAGVWMMAGCAGSAVGWLIASLGLGLVKPWLVLPILFLAGPLTHDISQPVQKRCLGSFRNYVITGVVLLAVLVHLSVLFSRGP